MRSWTPSLVFLMLVALASHPLHTGPQRVEGAADGAWANEPTDPGEVNDSSFGGDNPWIEAPPLPPGAWGGPPPAEPEGSDPPGPALVPDRDFHPSSRTPESPAGESPATANPVEPTLEDPVDLEPTTPPPSNSDVDVSSAPIRWAPRLLPFDGPASFIVTAATGILLLGIAIGTGNASSVPQVVRVRPFQRGRRLALAAAPRMPETALGLLGEAHHYGAVVACHAQSGEAKVSMRRNPRVPCEEVEGYLVGLFEAVWGRDIDIRHPECLDHTHSETCEYELRAVVRREVKTSSSYVPLRPDM